MADAMNLGRVQGASYFYTTASCTSSTTTIAKNTLTPTDITPLVGDKILDPNGNLFNITVAGTSETVEYLTSLKGKDGSGSADVANLYKCTIYVTGDDFCVAVESVFTRKSHVQSIYKYQDNPGMALLHFTEAQCLESGLPYGPCQITVWADGQVWLPLFPLEFGLFAAMTELRNAAGDMMLLMCSTGVFAITDETGENYELLDPTAYSVSINVLQGEELE